MISCSLSVMDNQEVHQQNPLLLILNKYECLYFTIPVIIMLLIIIVFQEHGGEFVFLPQILISC
jgi:hypothetical protein